MDWRSEGPDIAGEKYFAPPAMPSLVYFPPVSYYACPATYKEWPVWYQPPLNITHVRCPLYHVGFQHHRACRR